MNVRYRCFTLSLWYRRCLGTDPYKRKTLSTFDPSILRISDREYASSIRGFSPSLSWSWEYLSVEYSICSRRVTFCDHSGRPTHDYTWWKLQWLIWKYPQVSRVSCSISSITSSYISPLRYAWTRWLDTNTPWATCSRNKRTHPFNEKCTLFSRVTTHERFIHAKIRKYLSSKIIFIQSRSW